MSQHIQNRQIVDELKKGEHAGCSHLMQEYQHRLFDYLMHTYDIPREDSEEIVSDVLFLVVQRIAGFSFRKSDADFARWVFTILRNKVRDYWRVRKRNMMEMELLPRGDRCGEEGGTVEEEIVRAIVRDFMAGDEGDGEAGQSPLELVAETLQTMETWERVLLRCRALDIPYEDISRYVEKPPKQLKVYHGRVKQKFAEKLRKTFAEHQAAMPAENS